MTRSEYDHSRPYFLFISILALLLATLAVFLIYKPWHLYDLTGLLGRSSDFSGRSDIWSEGLNLFWSKPFFGWGFDDNATVVSQAKFIHTTFHNGFIDLAVKAGLTGLLLFISSLILGIKNILTNPKCVMIFLPIIISSLIYNLSEASIVAPRNILWLIFLFAIFVPAKQMSLNGINQ
jgi:O-antigen ligase